MQVNKRILVKCYNNYTHFASYIYIQTVVLILPKSFTIPVLSASTYTTLFKTMVEVWHYVKCCMIYVSHNDPKWTRHCWLATLWTISQSVSHYARSVNLSQSQWPFVGRSLWNDNNTQWYSVNQSLNSIHRSILLSSISHYEVLLVCRYDNWLLFPYDVLQGRHYDRSLWCSTR